MSTLTEAISEAQTRIVVSDPGSPREGAYHRIDDELVRLTGLERVRPGVGYASTVWYVARGQEGTVATSHDADATVTEWIVTESSGLSPEAHDERSHEGVPGVAELIADPGGVWEAQTAYAPGTRVKQPASSLVWEAADDFTSGAESPFPDGVLGPFTVDFVVTDNGGEWGFIGQVGGLPPDMMDASMVIQLVTFLGGSYLPISDPEIAGHLYTDGAPSPGVPKPLMVSGGPA